MPVNLVCQNCGHTRYISTDDLVLGRWRERSCPVCTPAEHDDDQYDDDAA